MALRYSGSKVPLDENPEKPNPEISIANAPEKTQERRN